MGRHIPTPFNIAIESEQGVSELKIESLLRTVPGRRLVGLSTWHDRVVIVKLFINRTRFKRGMLRDIAGINTLRQARIPTPNLLLQTTTPDNKAGVLILEYLRDGTSLAALFEEAKGDETRTEVLELGVKAVADCHKAGLWQNDIHLDNFMLSKGVVYVLDGAEIKTGGRSLDVATRLNNFARFLAQFPVEQDVHWPALVETYRRQAPGVEDADTVDFAELLKKARGGRLDSFVRKLSRSTTANRSEHGPDFYYVYDRSIHSKEFERFLSDPDSFIDAENLLKDGNSSTVAVVKIEERNYVLKRYNIKSFWHGLSRAFRPSRAYHSWRNASMLEMLGIATARPYLCLEERVFWVFRRRAYFLCEYLEGPDLGTESGAQGDEVDASRIVEHFGKLFETMADYRISHGDMKATNFLIKNGKLYVLDLDSMERSRTNAKFLEKYGKDLKRFRQNWVGTSLEPEVDKLLIEVAEH